jgi:hypothetical protein
MRKAVALLPISACLQNEQANFVARLFTNNNPLALPVRIAVGFHESPSRKKTDMNVSRFSWQGHVEYLDITASHLEK